MIETVIGMAILTVVFIIIMGIIGGIVAGLETIKNNDDIEGIFFAFCFCGIITANITFVLCLIIWGIYWGIYFLF